MSLGVSMNQWSEKRSSGSNTEQFLLSWEQCVLSVTEVRVSNLFDLLCHGFQTYEGKVEPELNDCHCMVSIVLPQGILSQLGSNGSLQKTHAVTLPHYTT